jgi:hypothetical protein
MTRRSGALGEVAGHQRKAYAKLLAGAEQLISDLSKL